MTPHRTSQLERKTAETQIALKIDLDGTGKHSIHTGVGFLDHMLVLFAKHALIDLEVQAQGDLQVDAHHTTEDIGICLGQTFRDALGDKSGIRRYGHLVLPMEETLVTSAVDFSGRSYLVFNAPMPSPKLGDFDSELVEDFWQAFANNAQCNLHILLHYGRNTHHIAEAIFKATARAIRTAIEVDPRQNGIPSSKGVL
jgi:imidazoleglycerol-phosphate dehydratase